MNAVSEKSVFATDKFINVTIFITIVTIMITIMKSGYLKIMRLFYRDKNARLHLREIARQAKLHEPSATRFLGSLEKEGILKAEKDGNLKKYYIKRNKRTYLVFEIFDLERFEKLPDARKSAISSYLEKLPEKPVFAVLFGSTAKETYGEDSDIDLLIITNKKIDAKEAEKEADSMTGIKISTFQATYANFVRELRLKEDRVVQSAVNTGYPIMNHLAYYEVLFNERI